MSFHACPCATATHGWECLRAYWCIQSCIWVSVSWSAAVLSCCNPEAGNHGAGATLLPDSSSSSSPARWPSCAFSWTSWTCSLSALRTSLLACSRKADPRSLGVRLSSTSPARSRRNPSGTPGKRNEASRDLVPGLSSRTECWQRLHPAPSLVRQYPRTPRRFDGGINAGGQTSVEVTSTAGVFFIQVSGVLWVHSSSGKKKKSSKKSPRCQTASFGRTPLVVTGVWMRINGRIMRQKGK